jgi:hypothetical protein
MQLQQRATPCKRLANSCRGTRISRGIYNPGSTFVAMYAVIGGNTDFSCFRTRKTIIARASADRGSGSNTRYTVGGPNEYRRKRVMATGT